MTQTMGAIHIELSPALTDTAGFDEATKEAAEDSGRGAEWRCLVAQSAIVRAFAGARLVQCGPEHVAWVMLLLRAFHCLEAGRGLLSRHADVGAEVLLRVASEIRLQQMLIRQPWESCILRGKSQEPAEAERAWHEVRDRLRAYTAWALASDLEYASARTNEEELRGVFRATKPEELPADSKEAAKLAFAFGQMEIVSEAEAEFDRRRVRERLLKDIQRLERWLADERLAPWVIRIDALRKKNGGWVTSSFGQLFDDSAGSFRSSLQSLSLKHEYLWYARSSRLIHGNTIDLLTWNVFYETDKHVHLLPRCLPCTEDALAWITDLANALSQVAIYLWAMRDNVLPQSGPPAEA